MITFRCPNCGGTIKASNQSAGITGKCTCGELLRIPGDLEIPINTTNESRLNFLRKVVLLAGGAFVFMLLTFAVLVLAGFGNKTLHKKEAHTTVWQPHAHSNKVELQAGNPIGPVLAEEKESADAARRFSWSIPSYFQYGCVSHGDSEEDRLAETLAKGEPTEKLAAAQALWQGHSRRNASNILKFLASPSPSEKTFRTFKWEVEAALQPQAILREMRAGDHSWGTWLAYLRPHHDIVPGLIAALKERPHSLPQSILALGNSGDPRALKPLMECMKSADTIARGFASRALGDLGKPEVETKLIEVLAGDDAWMAANACHALAKIGSKRALPALEQLVSVPYFSYWLDLNGAAMHAIVSIEKRVKPRDPAISMCDPLE
jgi:hypothetical protein